MVALSYEKGEALTMYGELLLNERYSVSHRCRTPVVN